MQESDDSDPPVPQISSCVGAGSHPLMRTTVHDVCVLQHAGGFTSDMVGVFTPQKSTNQGFPNPHPAPRESICPHCPDPEFCLVLLREPGGARHQVPCDMETGPAVLSGCLRPSCFWRGPDGTRVSLGGGRVVVLRRSVPYRPARGLPSGRTHSHRFPSSSPRPGAAGAVVSNWPPPS